MRPAPLGPVGKAMRRLGYALDSRQLVPNLVGIRGEMVALTHDFDKPQPFAGVTNKWDDYVGVVYHDGTMWHEHLFTATCDPGNIATSGRGTAVMKPGQYVDAYKLGVHRKGTASEHDAIINWGLTAPDYWRISRHGASLEVDGQGSEYIGLNIHRARAPAIPVPESVGPFSAGCQVIKEGTDWEWFITKVTTLAQHADRVHNQDYMTYTLLMLRDVTDCPEPQLRQDGATISLIPEDLQ
jgi:hypothetical protein